MNTGNAEIILAVFQTMAPFGFGKETLFGIGCRGKRQVIIGRKRPEIGILDAETQIVLIGETREKKAALAFDRRVGHLESRQIGKRHAKQLKTAPLETNGFRCTVPDDLARLDLPQNGLVWILGAGFAGGIGAIVECGDFTVAAFGALSDKPRIIRRLDAQAVHKAIAETVGHIDMVGIDPVAVALHDFDIAGRGHAAGLLVIGNLVGDQPVAVIFNANLTLRGNGVHIAIIDEFICLKQHAGVWIALVIG